jgi:predicted esterase
MTRKSLLVAALALSPAVLSAQAPPDVLSLYVGYITQRNTLNPQGAVRARLDSLERAFGTANRIGRTSDARRLLAEASTVLAGREWTDSADFATSLRLRSDGQIIASELPYTVRVQQTYAPRLILAAPVVHVVLRRRAVGTQQAGGTSDVVKDFPVIEDVSRDLLDTPLAMSLDLHEIPDGIYTLFVTVLDSARAMARLQMPVVLRKGIMGHATQLAAAATTAPPALRAELTYPGDRLRLVNQGVLGLSTFNVDAELASADSVAAAIRAGRDPFAGRTGDFSRHYTLTAGAASEALPYRVYVPTTYSSQKATPLVIALHGLGGNENTFFSAYGAKLAPLAESHGYIVVAPLGYRPDGSYGATIGSRPTDRAARQKLELSEADVFGVLAEVRRNYNIDPARIYLMGHSMGAIGTWSIAAKHPDIWAALGLFSGVADTTSAARMSGIPQFVVHGDADATVNVTGSRNMVAALKRARADVTYIEVPGGTHNNVVEPNLSGLFDFFATRTKPLKP